MAAAVATSIISSAARNSADVMFFLCVAIVEVEGRRRGMGACGRAGWPAAGAAGSGTGDGAKEEEEEEDEEDEEDDEECCV
jgi:hypothetical protein